MMETIGGELDSIAFPARFLVTGIELAIREVQEPTGDGLIGHFSEAVDYDELPTLLNHHVRKPLGVWAERHRLAEAGSLIFGPRLLNTLVNHESRLSDKELAQRGYVTLAPDYPNFGEYRFDPYRHGYASATMKGIWNHVRAVDLLQSLPQVVAGRIGCIGHSLGGHNTLFVASFDDRIGAMVTSCGFNTFAKHRGGDITAWSHKGYMPRIAEVYGNDPAKMPFDFPEVLAALAARPVFINAPLRDAPDFEVSGVKDCVDVALPVYTKIFNAGDRLVAVHPDAGHEFPEAIRKLAYEFLDRWLKRDP